ncbi:MAG: hypothetical protein LBF57_02665 [Holosporaceae bacterium]|nr:hypothetical protein [Holosporaceae bacterium]
MAAWILLYKDVGVSDNSFKHTCGFFKESAQIVDSDFLKKGGSWVEGSGMLVIPGGADKPYDEKLRGVGCENIKAFVRNGGTYLGICAGGYFGTSKVEFALGTDIEVNEVRELSFFQGVSRGPFLKDFIYKSEKGACAAKIKLLHNGDIFYAYFNGGCMFDTCSVKPKDMENIQVLGVYADKDEAPAIVKCKYGKGYAILSGVHFEYDPLIMKDDTENQEILQPIIDAIVETRKARDRFIHSLFGNRKF